MMLKYIVSILLLLSLTGCATQSHYGNFVDNQPGLNQHQIATDTVDQLAELFPPAHTRFDLKQPTPDAFGMALIRVLRDRGYAVLELSPDASDDQDDQQKTKPSTTRANASSQSGLPLRYVFDQFSGTNMYRVSIIVGHQSITRAYALENGTVVPAGFWARKE